jgi:hypothetical protein
MDPVDFQVTVDSDDSHAQTRFWAAALGYEVERHDDQIRALLEKGIATDADVDEPGSFHTTTADPEGNEFCVQ